MGCVLSAVLGLALCPALASAWETLLDSPGYANAVALDAAGDVIAAGTTLPGHPYDFTVAKLRGADGTVLWRYATSGTQNTLDEASAVAVDPRGDAVAAGYTTNAGLGQSFTVIKVAGTDGTERWRYVLDGLPGLDFEEQAFSVTVDPSGDVLAAGVISVPEGENASLVVKLASETGSELWRYRGGCLQLAVDPTGDVFVGGLALARLSGATGAELWRQSIAGAYTCQVALDRAGNLLAPFSSPSGSSGVVKLAGSDGHRLWLAATQPLAGPFAVDPAGNFVVLRAGGGANLLKLSGTDGRSLWARSVKRPGDTYARVFALAIDAASDIVVAGDRARGPKADPAFTVMKLRARDGALRWRHDFDGSYFSGGSDGAKAVAIDAGGDVIAAGHLDDIETGRQFVVVKLSGVTGNDSSLGRRFGANDTGFVPPDTATLACESTVARRLAAFAVAILACHQHAADAALRGTVFDVAACEAAARRKYDRRMARHTRCPACLDKKAIADSALLQLDQSANAAFYCAGTEPFGGSLLGFVPPDPATAACEDAVAAAIGQLVRELVLCHATAARQAFKGLGFEDGACEADASRDYYDATGNLKSCPPCLLRRDLLGFATVTALNQQNGNFYCASPSGAFLDPPLDF